MSSETKRDVLEKLAECYAEVSDAYTNETGSPYYCDDEPNYLDEYDAALPDDPPVIPKAVGVSIKEQKEKQNLGGTIFDAIFAVNTLSRKGVGRVVNWIVDNNEVFALAWVLDAWRVEETGEIVKLEMKEL
jgi:hypothetical protein